MFISNLLVGSVPWIKAVPYMQVLWFAATYQVPQNKSYMGSRPDSSAVCECGD